MSPDTVLTTVIEVAIGIAGFSGIVAALGRRNSGMSAEALLYLRVLLTASFLCIFFSFLPLLLATAKVSSQTIWIIPSGLWAATFLMVLMYRAIELRRTGVNFVRRPVVVLAAMCALTAVFLCLANVVLIEDAWPYLVSMVLILFAAAFSFIALLYEVLPRPPGS